MPDHAIAQSLIRKAGRPLAAPSANRSGTISPTRPEHVRESLGNNVDMTLDGGACPIGLESTIVKVDGDAVTLLRPGGVAREEIERLLGAPIQSADDGSKIQAPGMMTSHYAPTAKLRLNATSAEANEAFSWLWRCKRRRSLRFEPQRERRPSRGGGEFVRLFAQARRSLHGEQPHGHRGGASFPWKA